MFKTDGSYVHTLNLSAESIPEQFTYPFYYQPHPLCIKASKEIQDYLEQQTDFNHNFGLDPSKKGLQIGKMFGVMVVQNPNGTFGYLAAFSGKLAESNFLKGFVPPIYDTLNPDGFYKKGEAHLNVLNSKIQDLETNTELSKAETHLKDVISNAQNAIDHFKQMAKKNRALRRQKRVEAQSLKIAETTKILERLKEESIQSNLKLKYLKLDCERDIREAEEKLSDLKSPIETLKFERKTLSAHLQKQIHERYQFLDAHGNKNDLISIFKNTQLKKPPAAAGECAAPKLFQYAYEKGLKPIAMAEFWWGISPNAEVRKHKQFYPSCRGKCEPILSFMMQGLNVAPNPMEQPLNRKVNLDIIYEDEYLLLVNKPHDFLSVPGKLIKDSILARMQDYLPEAKGPLLLHRLDMSTSGLMLVAKNEKTHKNLQKQFINRIIKKRYVAILDGELPLKEGTIELPLRVDLNNRPRQLMCYHHGKSAKTKFEVVHIKDGKTRIHFYPITGRTHQLRVHAAHHKGLNIPIVGDDLYGTCANRLHLHAETLSFKHPVKNEWMAFKSKVPF